MTLLLWVFNTELYKQVWSMIHLKQKGGKRKDKPAPLRWTAACTGRHRSWRGHTTSSSPKPCSWKKKSILFSWRRFLLSCVILQKFRGREKKQHKKMSNLKCLSRWGASISDGQEQKWMWFYRSDGTGWAPVWICFISFLHLPKFHKTFSRSVFSQAMLRRLTFVVLHQEQSQRCFTEVR